MKYASVDVTCLVKKSPDFICSHIVRQWQNIHMNTHDVLFAVLWVASSIFFFGVVWLLFMTYLQCILDEESNI